MDVRDDVSELRQQFPEWNFGTVWTTAGSGPDRRRIWAFCDGILLSAWSAPLLRKQIEYEERRSQD